MWKFFTIFTLLCISNIFLLANPPNGTPQNIQRTVPSSTHHDEIITPHNPAPTFGVSGASNDICSEAVTLTVGTTFTCNSTFLNTAASSYPSTCVTTSGMGIQEFRTDWYCFNSGTNKTLALVVNNVTNTTSFTPAITVFGPYTTCTGGCAASMSGPMCDNGLSLPQIDSIKILENISQNSFYMISIMSRHNNPERNTSNGINYCISIQPTNLDDCESTPSLTCPPTCGNLCIFDTASAPTVTRVTTACSQYVYSSRIQGSDVSSPEDTTELCQNFSVDAGCTVSFGGVITASGCSGGNLTSASWSIYNTNTCAIVSSGTSVPVSASISTAGNYIYCFKYSAACLLHFGRWSYGYGTCALLLPVELSRFVAINQQEKVTLLWTTLSEENAREFEVERSADAIRFTGIGTIKSLAERGSSSKEIDYYLDDMQPMDGISYYRLKQTDISGQFYYSEIINVRRNMPLINVFSIQPNPAKEKCTINFDNTKAENLHLVIYNILGEIVLKKEIDSRSGLNTIEVDLTGFGNGLYSVQLSNDNAPVYSKLLVAN